MKCPLINYEVLLAFEPFSLLGTTFGVYVNQSFPSYIILAGLIIMLSFACYRTVNKVHHVMTQIFNFSIFSRQTIKCTKMLFAILKVGQRESISCPSVTHKFRLKRAKIEGWVKPVLWNVSGEGVNDRRDKNNIIFNKNQIRKRSVSLHLKI